MRWILAFLLAGIVLSLVWRVATGGDEAEYYAPGQYVDRANQLIGKGALKLTCEGERRNWRIDPDWQGATEYDRRWYAASYLGEDVRLFNGNPEEYAWYFLIDEDNCRLLGVREMVHTTPLPFASPRRWEGSLFYSGKGSDAALHSVGRGLYLRQPQGPVRAQEEKVTRVGDPEPVTGEAVLVLFGSRPAARLYHVGEHVVLNNRTPAGSGEVRLSGRTVPGGRIGRIETGDWLHLEHRGGSETFVYLGGEERPVASAMRRRNDRYHRISVDDALGWIHDPERDEWFPFVEGLALGMDWALARLPEERGAALADGFDVQLTVRRNLQRRLNEVLHRHFAQSGRSDFEAGVTVMDGRTGEVLAAVTYPWVQDLEGAPADDELTRSRRLTNQNFIRHPIGSAGKPFLFAAVANAHPFLMDLAIDGHPAVKRHDELLHCWLPLGYQVLGHGGRVDFRRALEISCNRYTVELATLALAAEGGRPGSLPRRLPPAAGIDWPRAGRSSGVFIGGRELTYAPDLGRFLVVMEELPPEVETAAVRRCETLDRLELSRLYEELEKLSGISSYRGKTASELPEEGREVFYMSYLSQRVDLRIWQEVLGLLIEERSAPYAWPVRATFQGLLPERVNLAFNNIGDLRRDFVSVALGGSFSSWTNLQLAEAMSRLVTGRPVKARLVQAVLPRAANGEVPPARTEGTDEDAPAEMLALRPEVRSAVLQGLGRVVEGGSGTARILRARLRELRERHAGDRIFLFSKTGSPVLERPASRPTGRALQHLVGNYLRLREGRLRIAVDDSTAEHHPQGGEGRGEFVSLLDRALRRGDFKLGRGRRFQDVLDLIDGFAGDRRYLSFASDAAVPEGLDSPLYAVAGRLRVNREDPLFTRGLRRRHGAVYVFSLVRIPGELGPVPDGVPTPAQLADPRSRVITVALHLTRGPDSRVAVATADHLLREVDLLE